MNVSSCWMNHGDRSYLTTRRPADSEAFRELFTCCLPTEKYQGFPLSRSWGARLSQLFRARQLVLTNHDPRDLWAERKGDPVII